MARGDGRVYSRSGSPWLWISYYCRGRENRRLHQSSRTRKGYARYLLRLSIDENTWPAVQVGSKSGRVLRTIFRR